jgi:hypothetical protein
MFTSLHDIKKEMLVTTTDRHDVGLPQDKVIGGRKCYKISSTIS